MNAHCIYRSLSIPSKELVNYLCCTNNRIFFVGSVYLHRLNAAEKSLDNEDLLRTFLWTFHAFADRPLSNRPINKWNRFWFDANCALNEIKMKGWWWWWIFALFTWIIIFYMCTVVLWNRIENWLPFKIAICDSAKNSIPDKIRFTLFWLVASTLFSITSIETLVSKRKSI